MRPIARFLLPSGSKQRMMAGRVKQVVLGTNRNSYRAWIRKIEPRTFDHSPEPKPDILISVIVPTFNTPGKYLKPLVRSLIGQTYTNWQLHLVDGSTDPQKMQAIENMAGTDKRIIYQKLGENLGISGNTNAGLKNAKGEFVAFLDHDDTLPAWALMEVRRAIEKNRAVDLIYSDEDKITEKGRRTLPFFKPDWSPALFLTVNYMAHFVVVRKTLVDKVGGLRPDYDGAQDYDFLLRLMDLKPTIVHIPKILYHWRMARGSTARAIGEKGYANDKGLQAVNDYLERNKIDAKAMPGNHPTNYRVKYATGKQPLVSIIIPFKDKPDLLRTCVESIQGKTDYKNYEIILVSNNSTQAKTFAYLKSLKKHKNIKQYIYDHPFNYSAVNNFGRKKAQGEVLVFLNNDTKVLNKEWLEELVGVAIQKDSGAVGAMLLYPDRTLQHAGVVVGLTGMAGHAFRNLKSNTPTPFGLPDWPRNYLAVTGACLAVDARKFDKVGGFNEEFIICGSDVTLCLDLYEAGYSNIYWPYAKLTHYESKSVGSYRNIPPSDYDKSLVHYGPYLDYHDPYFNPNLDLLLEIPHARRAI
jgi:O-antigen biosynthesis protein